MVNTSTKSSTNMINRADNATRAKLASAYYWDTNFNAVPADMSGGELHCDDCDPFGPYNTNWLNTRTFEDWTDGF
jgi:hypothetical protein